MSAATRVLVLDQAVGLWGAQRYLLRLAGPMRERGVELVLAGPGELDLAKAWQAAGLPFIELALPIARSVRVDGGKGRLSAGALVHEAGQICSVAGLISRAAQSNGCAAIHANGHGVHLDGALAARAARLPGILFLHEEMPQAFGRMLRNSAVAIADASVAVSRAVAAGVAPPLRRRVTVIPNGVDASQITPGLPDPGVRSSLGAGEGDVLLLALTRLDPEKRIEDLLTAVQPLKDRPGWHLAIAGVTSSYPEYAAWVQELAQRDLPGRVTFAGRREDVPLLLRSADLLVHAGVVEGMPLGLLEAQASALPVVAYRVAGVPEAVQHGVTGLLANPRDAAELGRHIARLVAAQTLRLQFGAAGRKHVERTHTLERQADAYARLLHHLRVACVAPLATTAS